MKNKLNQKGILVCSTPNGNYDRSLYTDPTHINVKAPKQWHKIFKKSGFSDIEGGYVEYDKFYNKW